MAELRARLDTLAVDRRRLVEKLMQRGSVGVKDAVAAPANANAPQPLDLSGAFAAGASERTIKDGYISFYNGVTDQLDASPFGAFSFFLNYGYVPDSAPQFAAVSLPEHYVNRNSVRLVLETIGDCDVAGCSVLDVGCGRGGTVFVLKEFFKPAIVHGIDLSPHAIEFCRRTHRYPGVRFEQGDAEHLPLPAASVQVVTNIESSHTYPHPDRFYDEVARVLTPGGYFLYTDVFEAGGHQSVIAGLNDRGLMLERDRDITSNVLLSCDEIARNRMAAFADYNDTALMQNFLAAPGSAVYDNLRRQLWVYRILKFRKNDGGSARRSKASVVTPPPQTAPHRGAFRSAPLGLAQQRLWIFEQLMPGTACYNESSTHYFDQPLDHRALHKALTEIVRRHEILRTTYPVVQGAPVQAIGEPFQPELPLHDLRSLSPVEKDREIQRLLQADGSEPFDLARGPMIRTRVAHLSEHRFVVLFTAHHILVDGWSIAVFAQELGTLYAAFIAGRPSPLRDLPQQYADYACRQRESVQRGELRNQLDYWTTRLRDVPMLNLPTDRPRPSRPSFRGAWYACDVPLDVRNAVERYSAAHNTTMFVTMMAAFVAMLARYTGQNDIAVGVPTANRGRSDVQPLIGFFVNTLVIRARVDPGMSFAELHTQIRDLVYGALANQEVPFERVVEVVHPDRDLSRNPLFQVSFQLVMLQRDSPAQSEPVDIGTAKFDLRVDLAHSKNGLRAWFEYATDLFDRATIERMARHFMAITMAAVDEPETSVGRLPFLTAGEREQLTGAFNPVEAGAPCSVPAMVSAHVRSQPHALALQDSRRRLTYGELDAWANRIARRLVRSGVRANDVVALILDRSVDLAVGMLACWKAGAAFLPIEPRTPSRRVRAILDDAKVSATIADTADLAGAISIRAIELDRDDPGPPSLPEPALTDLAYVIYTSGSTGEPRGVEVDHGALANLVAWHTRRFAIVSSDRASQVARPAFDASVWEIWPYLANGASVVVCPDATLADPSAIPAWLHREQIDVCFLPTPLAEATLDLPWPGEIRLRTMLTGGDRLRRRPRALPFALVNNYGPTENAVVATSAEVSDDGAAPPPIGTPIDNVRAYVLDELGQPVPILVAGELCLGGASLARGYRNQPDATAQSFIDHPEFGRIYKTGDIVRWRADGCLEFLNRSDDQLKIRGFRIEPAEIESALREHDAVREAVVVARQDDDNNPRLVAYVVPDHAALTGEEAYSEEHVAEWLQLYNQIYAQPAPQPDPTFNIIGWNSSYTGEPIDANAMREQIDGTVNRIRALSPRRILEIGCGTGMLLFRLAPDCAAYVGTDFSGAALDYIRPELAGRRCSHVQLIETQADQCHVAPRSVDVVVMNSTLQYFPSLAYARRVIDAAIDTTERRGHVFIGDVRDLGLQSWLHTMVELHRADPAMTVGDLRNRVAARVAQDRELTLSPAFFEDLPEGHREIARVSFELKRGRAHNELTKFRYDVTVTVDERPEKRVAAVEYAWEDIGSIDAIGGLLWDCGHPIIIRGIPNARLSRESAVMLALQSASPADRISALQRLATETIAVGIEPEEIWDLGADLGLQTAVRPGSTPDQMDALFVPDDVEEEFVEGWHDRSVGQQSGTPLLSSTPLERRPKTRIVATLRRHLADRLPEYMMPSSIVIVDALPMTANGKLDVRALPDGGRDRLTPTGFVAPRTSLENRITAIWKGILGIEVIGVHDNFFDLGGHSLLIVNLHQRMKSDLGVDCSVLDLFRCPTVDAQAGLAMQALASAQPRGRS